MIWPFAASPESTGNGYLGGRLDRRNSWIHAACCSTVLGLACRPSAESMITDLGEGVSPPQFRLIPSRTSRSHVDGKSAEPTVLSHGIAVMQYFVRFLGPSPPGPQCV